MQSTVKVAAVCHIGESGARRTRGGKIEITPTAHMHDDEDC